MMSGLKDMPSELIRQYSSVYGPYTGGEHAIGEVITGAGVTGEIIWSFRKNGTGPVTYVVDDTTGGFPCEVLARLVRG